MQGQVLPIGGLKQKVLAAHRAGLKTVIFPKLNEADVDDIPEDIRQDINLVMAETIDDVLNHALSSNALFEKSLTESTYKIEKTIEPLLNDTLGIES